MKTEQEIGLEILEHFGVKGMHWGIRREELRTASATRRGAKETERRIKRAPSPVRVVDTIGSSSVSKTKLKAVGGEDHPAHEDAIKVAAARQKMKKSGIHTLSNAELQQMAARMNLESQVHSLNSRRKKSIGQGFVDAHLAKAQQDPFGTVMKAHKIGKQVKKNTAVGAVAAVTR